MLDEKRMHNSKSERNERSKHTTKSSHIIHSKKTNSESIPKMEWLSCGLDKLKPSNSQTVTLTKTVIKMETMNPNVSYKDKCGTYRITAAELIPAKANSKKNDYIRLSLKKVLKNGRLQLGFSHYFNMGIKEYVEEYKRLGVTDKGTSKENLEAIGVAYNEGKTDAQYEYYGFWWTQPFGGIYKNKETGTVTSETLVFIPCDEDTGLPLPEFVMTNARLQQILEGYEKVSEDTAEQGATNNDGDQPNDGDDEEAAFREFMEKKKRGEV